MNYLVEKMLLGKYLLDNDFLEDCLLHGINEEDFEAPENKTIFLAMKALVAEKQPVDWITVTAELKKQGNLENVGGIQYLTLLIDTIPVRRPS